MNLIRNKEFDLAFNFINETNQNIFLRGKAGTGKTTFLKYLRENSSKKMVVAAPTGVAAINAHGVTLHSLFQLPFGIIIPEQKSALDFDVLRNHSILSKIFFNKEKLTLLNNIELLIIDEASMAASYIVDAIDAILRRVRRNFLQPFGGVQVLFIGDLYQLPPVVKRDDWRILQNYYSSIFFFDSFVLRNNPPVIIEFKEIFRQKEHKFIEILNGIRNNNITQENFRLLNERLDEDFMPEDDDGYITLTTHNYQSNNINQIKLRNLPGKTHSFYAEVEGKFPENIFPAEEILKLKKGAQVMFLKNDNEEKKYFNGKIGVITYLDNDTIKIKCKDDFEEIEVKKSQWENIKYKVDPETGKITEELLGTFFQYPLRLAWAITIHKSQGLTFDKVIIDAQRAFTAGQVYVALSRCTSLKGIILTSPINRNSLGTHKELIEWQKNDNEKDLTKQFLESKQNFFIEELQSIFTWRNWYYELKNLNEFLLEKKDTLPEDSISWINQLIEKQNNLYQISEKFKHVIVKLGKENSKEKNDLLQKRIKDGAEYFYNEIKKWQELFLNHPLSVNTKKSARKIDDYLEQINLIISETLNKINYCKNGFNLDYYLQNVKGTSGGQKSFKSSYKKIPKKNTIKETVKYFKEGKNIEQIAEERNLVLSTIESHFAKAIKKDLIQIEDVMPIEEVKKISQYFPKDLTDIKLTPIKEEAPDEITYGKLRMVLAWLQKNQQ